MLSDPGPAVAPPPEPYRLVRALAGPRSRVRRHLPLRWRRRLAVFVGGVLGGGARIGVSVLLDGGGGVPWGTLVANVTGALVLGYLLTRFLQAASRTTLTIPLLCTGLLGSYTTFSTFSLEAWDLLESGRGGLAAAYALGSVALGLAAAGLGIRLAERRG
jgi:CrcB protein